MTIELKDKTIFVKDETVFSLRRAANNLGENFSTNSQQANSKIIQFYQDKKIIFENCEFDKFSTDEFPNDALIFTSLEFIKCTIKRLNFFNTKIYESLKFNSETKIEYCTLHGLDVPNLEINGSNIKSLVLTISGALSDQTKCINITNKSKIGRNTGLEQVKINNNSPITFYSKSATFLTAPEITGQLNPESNFIDCTFNDLSFDSIQKYRQLKAIFKGHNDDKLADEFERLELFAMHENNNNSDWVNKIAHQFYVRYNDYGRNFIYPLGWMGLLFLISLGIFFLFNAIDFKENTDSTHKWAIQIFSQIDTSHVAKYNAALAQSLINSLGPIGFLYDNTGLQYKNSFFVLYAFVQKIIFTIMWYLFILQVRRKYKLS